jgi:hypothetical protein
VSGAINGSARSAGEYSLRIRHPEWVGLLYPNPVSSTYVRNQART